MRVTEVGSSGMRATRPGDMLGLSESVRDGVTRSDTRNLSLLTCLCATPISKTREYSGGCFLRHACGALVQC
jgi:hypothetical protein